MKRLYSIVASAMMGAFAVTASAQDVKFNVLQDLTSKIQNADFAADEPINGLVRTYAKDLADEGLGAGGAEMYGMQPVTAWTASAPTDNIKNDPSAVGADARAAGVFAYRSETDEDFPDAKLGGDFWSPIKEQCETVTGNNTLGIVGVWSATVQYTQDITLPSGAYAIIVPVMNTGGSDALSKNLTGFVSADGVEYFSTKRNFAVNVQEVDTIMFELAAETAGKLSIGYAFPGVGSAKAYHLFTDCIKLYSVDMTPAKVAQAKETLLALITEGQQLDANTDAAQAVYDDPNATLEQVLAAIESQKVLNEGTKKDLSEFFITNPHFNLDAPIEDGITTYCYDMESNEVEHFGMQPVTGWVASNPTTNVGHPKDTYDKHEDPCGAGRSCGVFAVGSSAFLGAKGFLPPTTMRDGATEGKVLGFLTCWSLTTQYKQGVTIPAGKYTLTISYYNAGGADAVDRNLMGFITNDGDEYLCDVKTFEVGKWNTMSVFFELEEATSGYFSLGYKAANAGSAQMPHFFIDGISLNYVGEVNFDPSLLALQVAVSNAQNLLDGSDMQVSLLEQFEAAIEAGNALVKSQSSDVEANKAAADAINGLMPIVTANKAAYEKLQEFKDGELTDAIGRYESLPTVASALTTLADQVDSAIDNLDLTTEEIEKIIASLPVIIKEEVQKLWDEAIASGAALENDLDITSVLSGVAYTYSKDAKKGNNCPDKEWAYGSADNFSTQFGCAEVWSQSPFTVTRTMNDMPAGTYTITTRAFYRTAGNQTSYDAYTGGDTTPKAFVYAGNNRAAITNVAELARAEADYAGGTATVGDLIVPNNREAAHNIFENEAYAELVETSVKTVLTEKGDLKFGITADQLEGDSWVVWYSFQVAYNAIELETLAEELAALIAQAEETKQNDIVGLNAAAMANLETAIQNGEVALGEDLQAMVDAVKEVKAALAYADETLSLNTKLVALADEFDNLLKIDLPSAANSDELYALIGQAQGDDGFADNDDMKSYFDKLPTAWTAYVLSQEGIATASLEEPLDVTPAILNADCNNGFNYWSVTPESDEEGARVAQNQSSQSNRTYKYTNADNEEVAIEKFIEGWNPKNTELSNGVMGQTIKVALPAGYYRLEADGFAIIQDSLAVEGVHGVSLMAQSTKGTWTTSICIVDGTNLDKAAAHYVVDFESDGTSLTTVGILVQNANATWFVADNFTLSYLGTVAPTAIKGVAAAALAGKQPAAIYTVGGLKVGTLTKGINIVKQADGSVIKVVK